MATTAAPVRKKSGCALLLIVAVAVGLLGMGAALAFVLLQPSAEKEMADEPAVGVAVPAGAVADNPTDKAQRLADLWDGKGEFRCGSGEEVTLKGKGSLDSLSSVRADGDCQLTLIDCELSGDPAVDVRDSSRVTIKGGKIKGTRDYAIRLWAKTKLEMVGTEMTGGATAVRMDEGAWGMLTDVKIMRGAPSDDETRAMMMATSAAIHVDERGVLGLDNCQIHWVFQGVDARSDTSIAIRNSTILVDPLPSHMPAMMSDRAAALAFDNGSNGIVVGGQLGGPKNAVRAVSNAVVSLEAVKLLGNIERVGGATVREMKESPNAQKELGVLVATVNNARDARSVELALISSYEKLACAGVIECFRESGHEGVISGVVSTVINQEGKATSSTVEGSAPAKIQRCLRELAKGRVLKEFKGPAGTMKCSYSGRLSSGGQMVSLDAQYVQEPSGNKGKKR